MENSPLVRSLLGWEPRSLSGKDRWCHESKRDLGATIGGAGDGGSGRMRCLYLGCFPGGWGKFLPPSPVLLEGRGSRQDDLGDKVACSSEPGLGGITVEEEALGHLRLGSGACQDWTLAVPL